MSTLSPEVETLLDRLSADLPQLRADHPDDFWAQFQRRSDDVIEHTPPDLRPQAQRRIDEILIAHQLGPADPGA
ncbi:MAG TPA: hypothetical protein VM687_13820 [Stenotrophomonas sp.]|nr:hypothetical protein [Stenotrophomonas sp.]